MEKEVRIAEPKVGIEPLIVKQIETTDFDLGLPKKGDLGKRISFLNT
jgi:hypothetical protein